MLRRHIWPYEQKNLLTSYWQRYCGRYSTFFKGYNPLRIDSKLHGLGSTIPMGTCELWQRISSRRLRYHWTTSLGSRLITRRANSTIDQSELAQPKSRQCRFSEGLPISRLLPRWLKWLWPIRELHWGEAVYAILSMKGDGGMRRKAGGPLCCCEQPKPDDTCLFWGNKCRVWDVL